MKRLLIFIEKKLLGKKKLQKLFEMLHRISLRGMYYNQAQNIKMSGETFAMKYAENKFNNVPKNIFDIGGHKGDWTDAADRIFSNSQIFIFEPSSLLFDNLASKFKHSSNIHFINKGVSNTTGFLKLYDSGKGTATSYPLKNGLKHEEISTITIDMFCVERNINDIFYMKIDVEGNEFKVLEGCKNLLDQRRINYIQFEFGPNNVYSRVFLNDFLNLLKDYNFYRIVKNGLVPFIYNERYEIMLTANYLAELKK